MKASLKILVAALGLLTLPMAATAHAVSSDFASNRANFVPIDGPVVAKQVQFTTNRASRSTRSVRNNRGITLNRSLGRLLSRNFNRNNNLRRGDVHGHSSFRNSGQFGNNSFDSFGHSTFRSTF